MPEKESDHLTPATRLLEKRREMAEIEQALTTQKEVSRHCLALAQSLELFGNFLVCSIQISLTLGVSNEDGNTSAEKR